MTRILAILLCIAVCANAAKLTMQQAMHAGDHIIPAKVKPLWNSLNFRQKIAQTMMVYATNETIMAANEFGGALVMGNHIKRSDNLKATIQRTNERLKIPLLVAVDQEGGKVNRLKNLSNDWAGLPSARQMREMSEDSIFAIANRAGKALAGCGINLNLAPVLDPDRDSRNKKTFMEISDRSFGPSKTAEPKIRAYAKGMKAAGVVSTSKHFPGYDSWTNSDLQIAISTTPRDSVIAHAKFFTKLTNDVPVIMMSSVRFIRFSNKPVVFEPRYAELIRRSAPNAVLLTDDLWGASLRSWISEKENIKNKKFYKKDFQKLIREVVLAGNDMFMMTYPQKAIEMIQYIETLAEKDPVYRAKIEQAAARVIRLKYEQGILKIESK